MTTAIGPGFRYDQLHDELYDEATTVIGELCETRARATQVARTLGVSVRTLQRVLAARGTSFSEIHETVRWYAASIALAEWASVRRAGELAGFATTSHFCVAFKAHFGVSPGAFRAAARHESLSWGAIARSHRDRAEDDDRDDVDFVDPRAEAHIQARYAITSQMTPRGEEIFEEMASEECLPAWVFEGPP